MFEGSIVALVTPMFDDGSIDHEALIKLIDLHCANNTSAIVAMGTTGESATVDFAEHSEIVRFVVEQVDKRVPVIAGTGANSTQEAMHLTEQAKQAGADACLLVTPYYNKPTQEGLYLHYKAIAESVDIPQILYNVPGRTAVDMQAETVKALSVHRNIIGLKEASGSVERVRDLVADCPDDFAVYSGDDDIAMDCMLQGAKGVISVTANVAPAAMHAMCQAALAGNAEQARQINDTLMALHQNLFLEANPIPVKWALHKLSLIQRGIRLPLTWLSESHHAAVSDALQQAGLLTD